MLNALKEIKVPFVLMIAHRMETILGADMIINLEKGKITSMGDYQHMVEEGLVEDISLVKKKSERK